MNFDTLSYVKFGDKDGLGEFLFENDQQHLLFAQVLTSKGVTIPQYPILDAEPSNLDDWLLLHNQIHQALASALGLDNPFQLLDADWRVEEDFYDWIGVHESIHEQIAAALGVS